MVKVKRGFILDNIILKTLEGDELVAYVAKLVGQAQLHQVPLSEQPHQHKLLPHRPSSVSLS